MKKLIVLLSILLILLTACDAIPEGRYEVSPLDGQVITPGATLAVQGRVGILVQRLTQTPLPTYTPYPTYTPPPSASPYPTYTPGSQPSLMPSPTPGSPVTVTVTAEIKSCLAVGHVTHNLRADHSATSALLAHVDADYRITVHTIYVYTDVTDEWLYVSAPVREGGVKKGWIKRDNELDFGADDTLDICLDTSLTPTAYDNHPLPTQAPTATPMVVTPVGTAVPSEICHITVSIASLRIRSTDNTSGTALGSIPLNGVAEVYQTSTKSTREIWVQISYAGKTGWSAMIYGGEQYAVLSGPCDKIPEKPVAGLPVPADTLAGMHTIFSANADRLSPLWRRLEL